MSRSAKYVGQEQAEHLAARANFNPSDAVELWDLINRQDWGICERSQKGMLSRVWKGGRYNDQEPQVYDFDRYVRERLGLI